MTTYIGSFDLGQLAGKTYGSGTHAVSETLAYNIQGWRTGQQVKKGSSTLFESTLHYYDPVQSATVLSFTGNITEWAWQHGATSEANRYAFTYDRLARLSDSRRYVAGVETTAHSEKGLYYDRNGNLTALIRYGSTGLDDDFTCTYNGNQINTLTDGTTSCAYAHDANGNTKHDGLHNLDIDYNFLNLPWKVQQSKTMKARYSYYADGTKFSVSDALSGFVYRGSLQYNYRLNKLSLESASFGGGRIYKTSSGYEVRYHVTDHLGSVRATVNQNGVVGDRSDYLPFGLRINADGAATTNRYLYNGKELQVTGSLKYLDYGARFYDPTIGRWTTQDPLAEKYYSFGSYGFTNNNPLLNVDMNGMEWYSYEEEYRDEDGVLQTRTEYKYVRGTMSKEEMKKGGYAHLGQTYDTGDTYFSLGGARLDYDESDYFQRIAIDELRSADRSTINTVRMMNRAGDFWDNYSGLIGTGSDVATILANFMDASKGVKGAITFLGGSVGGVNLLTSQNFKEVTKNVIFAAGFPGAALSLAYRGAQSGATFTMKLEQALQDQAKRISNRFIGMYGGWSF